MLASIVKITVCWIVLVLLFTAAFVVYVSMNIPAPRQFYQSPMREIGR